MHWVWDMDELVFKCLRRVCAWLESNCIPSWEPPAGCCGVSLVDTKCGCIPVLLLCGCRSVCRDCIHCVAFVGQHRGLLTVDGSTVGVSSRGPPSSQFAAKKAQACVQASAASAACSTAVQVFWVGRLDRRLLGWCCAGLVRCGFRRSLVGRAWGGFGTLWLAACVCVCCVISFIHLQPAHDTAVAVLPACEGVPHVSA